MGSMMISLLGMQGSSSFEVHACQTPSDGRHECSKVWVLAMQQVQAVGPPSRIQKGDVSRPRHGHCAASIVEPQS